MIASQPSDVQPNDPEVVNKTTRNLQTEIGHKYSAKGAQRTRLLFSKLRAFFVFTDVIKVWDCISRWIENNINQEKVIVLSWMCALET